MLHYANAGSGKITGVLYRGDSKNKYSLPNEPVFDVFRTVTPSDFALIDLLDNEEEAGKFMLHMIDQDPDRRQILPSIPTSEDLLTFRVPAERHFAYQ